MRAPQQNTQMVNKNGNDESVEIMDIDEFKILCLDLVEMSFVFNGPESPATLNVAQVC